jgi:hypothetical protein
MSWFLRAGGVRRGRWLGALVLATLLLAAAAGQEKVPLPVQAPTPRPTTPRVTPRFEALAETKLLMEGLAMPNYQSLEKFLKDKPADPETWTFARGQALLIAETGNLLLLRPPRSQGRDAWNQRAMDMRQAAGVLARQAGKGDLEASRAALTALGNACNKCHQTFRVPVRVGPGAKPGIDTPMRDVD